MFIKLTHISSKREFYLNIKKIEFIKEGLDSLGSAIYSPGNENSFEVKESPEEIMQLIKEASKWAT